jgi:hypothetical protein
LRGGAAHVDKILEGANPADLPVAQPTKPEIVFNLKTASEPGLAIPRESCCWPTRSSSERRDVGSGAMRTGRRRCRMSGTWVGADGDRQAAFLQHFAKFV